MRKKPKRKIRFCIIFILEIFLFLWLFSIADAYIMPPLKEISHMQCKAYANQLINTAAEEVFLDYQFDELQFLPEISENRYVINTALINSLCTSFSQKINDCILNIPDEEISIPIGAAFGFDFLADKGPEVSFALYPMGSVNVDYDTEFISAGINQVNYKIWLNVSMEIKIVNPLYDEIVTMDRKILLSDIVLSGNVPDHYFHMSSPNEYLLTE